MIFVYTLFETYHKLGFFFYPLPLPVTAASAKTMHQVNAIQFHQYFMWDHLIPGLDSIVLC